MVYRSFRFIHFLFFSLILISLLPAEESSVKNVLVLNSYHQGYFWADRMMKGLFDSIPPELNIEFHVNYMDTKRISDPGYFSLLKDLYSYKYSEMHFDAIISMDDNALNFLLNYRNEIFSGVPVVFTGINDWNPSRIEGHSGYTGMITHYDMQANTELVLSLHPGIERIAVVLDDTVTGQAMENRLRRIETTLPEHVQLEFWNDLEPEEITRRLKLQADSTAIIWGIYLRTPSGSFISTSESLKMVIESSSLPVYCLWDVVGLGALGGLVSNPEYLGSETAKSMLRILDGDDPDLMPVGESPLTYIFDYRVLKKSGIRSNNLPEPRQIRYKPFSFIREYPLITSLTLIILVLHLFIIFVLLYYRRLEKANTEVITKALDERTILLRELHHRTKNNMQLLISMISLSRSGLGSDDPDTILSELENKVHTISLVHTMLDPSENLSHIMLKQYVEELISLIKNNYTRKLYNIDIRLTVDKSELNIDLSTALGFILNELLSNSCKHAFPDSDGIINIEIAVVGDILNLQYSDNGIGLSDTSVLFESKSLGFPTIYDMITNQFYGSLEVDTSSGLAFSIKLQTDAYQPRL